MQFFKLEAVITCKSRDISFLLSTFMLILKKTSVSKSDKALSSCNNAEVN